MESQPILEHLTRDELVVAADALDVEVRDRRSKAALIEGLARAASTAFLDIPVRLSRDRLRPLCRKLSLDDAGREKGALVARILGEAPKQADRSHRDATTNGVTGAGPAPNTANGRIKKAKSGNGAGDLGFEAKLWQAADKLRKNMDAAEYK